jgi:hypothetical protein
MKLKSSKVRVISSLVLVAFNFFLEEGFGGETFLLFEGSSSSLGGVTFPLFYLTSIPSSPLSTEMDAVYMDALSRSWTSSVFFILLGPTVSGAVSGL